MNTDITRIFIIYWSSLIIANIYIATSAFSIATVWIVIALTAFVIEHYESKK